MFPFSDEELYPVVQNSIDKVRPMLQRDGGDIKLLGIKQTKVFVHLTGACHGCSASGQTLKFGVQRQLQEDIHPQMQVINITHENEFNINEY